MRPSVEHRPAEVLSSCGGRRCLRGTLLLTAGVSAAGALLTLVLPEPAGRSLEAISGHHDVVAAAERLLADTGPTATVAEA